VIAQASERPAAVVHELVERSARAQPEAVALRFGDECVTYAALEARANQLAHRLGRAGVEAETLVGVCARPSIAGVVAILGVLKAGAAYLPLDPAYPTAHLRSVLADGRARLVLAQPGLEATIVADGHRVMAIEEDACETGARRASPPVLPRRSDDLAYVVYTSGSTGDPNGVMIEHGSLVNTVAGLCDVYGMRSEDRVLQFAPLGFDVSVEELFIALAAGATLVGGEAARSGSLRHFLAACGRLGITVLELPTAFWHVLVDFLATTACALPPSVRLVIIGGEAARPDAVEAWNRLVGHRPRLLNAYGLTETTITTHVGDPMGPASRGVSIGRPIPGVRARVLDAAGRLVAPGHAGELHVGGRALARGYRFRPDLTAARFLDPDGSGTRLFRTGDLVREAADGTLEFVARKDEQLKVRGFRVEPAEVERALHEHPAIRAVAVGQRAGADTLVAWAVMADASVGLAELQGHVRRRLPAFMVPDALEIVPELPLAPSGKVDRRRLARGDSGPGVTDAGRAVERAEPTPASAVEDALLAIWGEVLGAVPASVEDSFIALGGHSLRATQVLARVRERFGVEISFRDFMRRPTVAALAQRIRAADVPTPHGPAA
jgi:amino acid adenylation domain-containing protein